VAGYTHPTTGTVAFEGHDIHAEYASLRSRIGMVPQDDVVHGQLTVEQALMFAAELRLPPDTTKEDRARVVAQVLEELEMTQHRKTRVDKLSGGQRKRVSIALELLANPSVFFLDEPTSGLDPGYEKRVMGLLRTLASQGRTILLVTHATQNIELCDHVAFMANGGHLAFFGPPRAALTYFECTDYPGIYLRLQEGEDASGLAARYQQHDACRQYVRARLPESAAAEVLRSTLGDHGSGG